MDLEQAVLHQIGQTAPESVAELVLDTCKATKITGLDKFVNLRMLMLNGCGITTLEGFPTLSRLTRLELADNQLSDGLEMLQDAGLLSLKSLSLAGNKFSSLEQLEPLVRAAAARRRRRSRARTRAASAACMQARPRRTSALSARRA